MGETKLTSGYKRNIVRALMKREILTLLNHPRLVRTESFGHLGYTESRYVMISSIPTMRIPPVWVRGESSEESILLLVDKAIRIQKMRLKILAPHSGQSSQLLSEASDRNAQFLATDAINTIARPASRFS